VAPSTVINSDHYLTFFSIDLKGCLGTSAKVQIQQKTMCRIALGLVRRLALQACHADPESYRESNDLMRRTYGLTVIDGAWSFGLMIAETRGELVEPEPVREGGETSVEKIANFKRNLDWKHYVSH